MNKLIVIPNSRKMIDETIDLVDGFIIGVNNLCVNLPCTFSLDEVKEISNYLINRNKKVFISLNKNMHNNDLPELKNTLLELDKYNITGIMYYDISVVNFKHKLNLKNDLVWSQEHLTTNYSTINFWNNQKVKYTYLSSEITLREIKEIGSNTSSQLLINVFGYIPIFTSRRKLVTNYLKTFNITKQSDNYFIAKEGKTYPIIDNNLGTVAYTNYILNMIKEVPQINKNYLVLNSFLIDNFIEIIKIYKQVSINNIEESYNKINDLVNNTSTGFTYIDTIYKVK